MRNGLFVTDCNENKKKNKNKRLVDEKEIRVALSTLSPRFDKFCANKQQPSH